MAAKRADEVQVGDVVEVVGYVVKVSRVEIVSVRRVMIGWDSQRVDGRSIVAGNAKLSKSAPVPVI